MRASLIVPKKELAVSGEPSLVTNAGPSAIGRVLDTYFLHAATRQNGELGTGGTRMSAKGADFIDVLEDFTWTKRPSFNKVKSRACSVCPGSLTQ